MSAFEKLYNSTLKICPYKPKELLIDEEAEIIDEERIENGIDTVKEGGFIDLNIPVSANPKESYKEYEKMDPVAIYRNKMSLKNVPYDVDKVNVLYNRTHPGSQSFTSWINNAEKKSAIEGKYYRNFVRWMDSNLRRSLWKEKCATGIQRVKHEELNGVYLKNIYKLIDFDYHVIWEYAYEKDGKYNILVNARRTSEDNIPTNITTQISKYHKLRVSQPYFRQCTEAEFYGSADLENYFLHPEQYEVVDRENVSYANCQPATIKKLFQKNDPRLPQLREGSRAAYEEYVNSHQGQQDIPEEKKNLDMEKKEEVTN